MTGHSPSDDDCHPDADDPETTHPDADRPIRVLHVDDDPDFGDLTATFLERTDDRFAVDTATDAATGIDRLEAASYDCVVSDYEMPGTDGFGFLEAVRERDPDLPFVLFTGRGSEAVASEAIARGVTDYIQKRSGTEQFDLLANRLANAVSQRRATTRAESLERVRRVLRSVNQALVRARTTDEIDRRVSELLSEADPYLFAWIGDHDPEAQTVTPRAGAGADGGYLDDLEITTDASATGQGPTGRAVRTRELAVAQQLSDDERFEPWREEALERGYRSSAAVPLVHDDVLYGVLNLYADRTDAFDERERALLSELGDDVAHALYHAEVSARWRGLFERSPDALFVHTPTGDIVEANQEAVDRLGYSREELYGMNVTDFSIGRPPDGIYENWERMDVGDRYRIEGVHRRKDGSTYPVELWITKIEMGDRARFIAISREISERKAYEAELERQNERLSQVVGMISHDLRNPLNVAAGRLSLAMDDCDSDHLDPVGRALDRCEALVDDLLDLVRDGGAVDDREAVDLRSIVDESWRIVGTDAATIRVETDRRVRADRTRLRHLVDNLLYNAVEHGSPADQSASDESAARGGRGVTVTVGDTDEGFYVADDGPGIPPEEREAVFEAGHSSTATGTGLGLAIVREVARAHGWTITLTESDAGGARFEVGGVDVVEPRADRG